MSTDHKSVKIGESPWLVFGFWEVEMQFQINGQDYYLKFVEEENRFYVFRATESGIDRYPVYVDSAKQEWAETFRNGSKRIQ